MRLTLTSPHIHIPSSFASPPSPPSPLIPLSVFYESSGADTSQSATQLLNHSRDVGPAPKVDNPGSGYINCYRATLNFHITTRFGIRPTHPPIFIIQFLYPSSTSAKEIDHARQSYTSSHICRLCCRRHRTVPEVLRSYCRSCPSSLALDFFGVKTVQHFRILYGACTSSMCHLNASCVYYQSPETKRSWTTHHLCRTLSPVTCRIHCCSFHHDGDQDMWNELLGLWMRRTGQ